MNVEQGEGGGIVVVEVATLSSDGLEYAFRFASAPIWRDYVSAEMALKA